ncbi:MAG: glycine cleavage system protein GcvH [Thermoanaerobacteraceae bacterium]
MRIEKGIYYSKDHVWLRLDGDTGYIGITDYAQDSVGDIEFIDLPAIGDDFIAGDVLGVVESAKAASDIYMPVDGKILNVNKIVSENPVIVNEEPYENWLVAVEIKNKSQIDELLTDEQYKEFLVNE